MIEGENSNSRSTVAELMRKITQEIEAMNLGLSGLSEGSSRHVVIDAKYDRIGDAHKELITEVGEEKARDIIIQVYTQGIEGCSTPPS